MVILLVFCGKKATSSQHLGAFLQPDWARRAGLLRRSPRPATKYQHYGDREYLP